MGQVKPFRFGHFAFGTDSRREWIETARKVEAAGYSSLLIGDHVGFPMAPLTALATAAEVTTSLRLGCLVFGNDFRNPVMLAKEMATLDLLSGGRVEFGLGSGYMRNDYDQSGISFDSPGVRVSRFEEAVQVVKGFFSEAPFSYQGHYYNIDQLQGSPKPVQRPYPPLILGGGAKRTLSIAAREAEIVSVNMKTTPEGGFDFMSLSADATAQKVEWVRQAAGERFDKIELNALFGEVTITDDRQRAAEEGIQRWGMADLGMDADWFLSLPSTLIGTVDEVVEGLLERRERYGFSYIATWTPIHTFAPVIERLAGK